MPVSKVDAQTILYVDQDDFSRASFASSLRDIGYYVKEAANADDAIASLSNILPDFIICDSALPNMAATELLRVVRERYDTLDGTPFILVSDYADSESVLSLRELGADDVILKPIDLRTMKLTLQACLAQVKRLQRSNAHAWKPADPERYGRYTVDVQVSFSNLAGTLDGMSRGIIYLDSSGNIKNMNRTAEAIVSEGSFLKVASGRLCVMQAPPARTLREAIRAATRDQPTASVVPIPRETQAPLVLHVCPLDIKTGTGLPTVAVVVIDLSVNPPLSASIIAKIYDLTRTEARIAVALADGNRLDQIAKQFNVSSATVSFHVQNLFRKTRTTRQSDLVALLMRSSISAPVLQVAA